MLYCKSNPYYWTPPNHPSRPTHPIVKVGQVHSPGRTPEDRDSELFKTGVPAEFKTEFKRKVESVQQWERWVHQYFELKGLRVHPRREFVIATLDEVRALFEMIPGTWVQDSIDEETESEDEDDTELLQDGPPGQIEDGVRRFMTQWSGAFEQRTTVLYDQYKEFCESQNLPRFQEGPPIGPRQILPHTRDFGRVLGKLVKEGVLKKRQGNGHTTYYWKESTLTQE